ncbi:MAG TPA: UDP-glucose 4-epimerase GalE [Trueperaceae bacterium]|nr:UDP-glucose 4-epimerase GalE [Trueperaceae bacterium]
MKVLVTGGAGYIGSVTAQALLAAGHGVVVVDDLSTGHRGAVPEGARLVVADAGDARAMRALMAAEGVEAVMHFAALSLVGDSMREPLRYYRHNVGGAIGLLEACVAAGVGRFVLSSTAAVYGTPDVVPVPETAALRPASVYGETKLAIERLLHWLSVTRGLGYAALRYFNAAGAAPGRGEDHRPETHLVPLVLQAALGRRPEVTVFGSDYPTPDGTAVRDYVHVEDLARAHVLALEALAPGVGGAYNLGNGAGFSVREVIDVCRRVTGADLNVVEAPRRAGDPPVLVADASKAAAELGWRPRFADLEAIVASAWAWHSAQPDGYEG